MWDTVVPSMGGGEGSGCEIGATTVVDTCDGEKNWVRFRPNRKKILCPEGLSHTG
jgi:hypothetical protein